jgi:hypothetical protein
MKRVENGSSGMRLVTLLAVLLGLLMLASNASATHVQCGETITQDTTLDSDLVCPDGTPAALTVAADQVTLDLAGWSVQNGWTEAGRTVAVNAVGPLNRLTIRNGAIAAGDKAFVLEASNSRFEDLSVNGHVKALDVNGDHNVFRDLSIYSGFKALDIDGDRLVFERSDARIHPNEQLGHIYGHHNRIRWSEFRDCGSSGLSLHGSDLAITRNALLGCGVSVAGDGAKIERNRITDSANSGMFLTGANQVVSRNVAFSNGETGIRVLGPGTVVSRNVANDNGELGIEAGPGVIDGGGNRATGNGNPAQCIGVLCR